ncbi:MAG: hypothetical protein K6E22_15075 [Treponema sp.]|nr:hypothetical protein [Treponema sp.]
MTLKEKYERCLQDSENFITGEKENVTPSYGYGKRLAKFFNDELDFEDINIHYGYPMEKIIKDNWDLKIRFQLRKPEIERFSPLGGIQVFKYLSTLADSEWSKGEPLDSEAKEISRGVLDTLNPIQQGLSIKSIGVEWAVHVPDCTTFFVSFFYVYKEEEEMEMDMDTEQ